MPYRRVDETFENVKDGSMTRLTQVDRITDTDNNRLSIRKWSYKALSSRYKLKSPSNEESA